MPHVSIRRSTVLSIILITEERSQGNIAMALKLFILFGVSQLFSLAGATKGIRTTKDEMLAGRWTKTDWEKLTGSDIKWVCQNEVKNCDITLEDLERELLNATEVWIIDNEYDLQYLYRKNGKGSALEGLERQKNEICDLMIVKGMEDIEDTRNYVRYYTSNRCDWTEVGEKPTEKGSFIRSIDKPEEDFGPDCGLGLGWVGTLETLVEEGEFKINWAALVRRPRCVRSVTLIDEENNLEKTYRTTWGDNSNIPIEYKNCSCKIAMRITFVEPVYEEEFARHHILVKPHEVRCETGVLCKAKTTTDNDQRSTIIAVACSIGVIILLIVILILVKKKQGKGGAPQVKENTELNDQYGTYYQGAQYNIVTDHNQLYNEDKENDNAIVTDENAYYYSQDQNQDENGATSPNGNIYHQL